MKYLFKFNEQRSKEEEIFKVISDRYTNVYITSHQYNNLRENIIPIDNKYMNYLLKMKLIAGSKVEIGNNNSIEIRDNYSKIDNSDDKIVINQIYDNYFIVKDIPRNGGNIDLYKCDNLIGLLIILNKLYRVYKSDIISNIDILKKIE